MLTGLALARQQLGQLCSIIHTACPANITVRLIGNYLAKMCSRLSLCRVFQIISDLSCSRQSVN